MSDPIMDGPATDDLEGKDRDIVDLPPEPGPPNPDEPGAPNPPEPGMPDPNAAPPTGPVPR